MLMQPKGVADQGAESSREKCNLLIVANFPSDVGYAWKTIGEYFLALSEVFRSMGSDALVCYPKVEGVPAGFEDAGLRVVEFDFFGASLLSAFRFLRRHGIRVLYLTDRSVYSPKYLVSRWAGVRQIVVHDRTSGRRDEPQGFKLLLKKVVHRMGIVSVDLAIGVSEFVADRLRRVSAMPPDRVVRLHNAVDVKRFSPGGGDLLHRELNIAPEKRVVFSHSRANRYKGVQTLIEAAARMKEGGLGEDVVFVFCGDGPDLEHFRALARERGVSDRFLLPGRCEDVHRLIPGADVVVVPSIWQEAFGLSVVEGMASGRPVVATRVGGIVEIIRDGEDGFLFDPEDSEGLARILRRLLEDDALRERIGATARAAAVARWSIDDRKEELKRLFRDRVICKACPRLCRDQPADAVRRKPAEVSSD